MAVRAHPKGQPAPNKGQEYPADVLTDDELDAILDTCSTRAPTGIRDRAMLKMLSMSGLRVNEIVSVLPHGLDFSRHSIRLGKTKSGQAQTRGWHPSADDSLLRWVDTRKALGIPTRAPLFCTLKGTPVSTQQVRNMVKRRAARAGVTKRAHPHMLRHTFADRLRRGGVDLLLIRDLLGHSSIAVTEKYLHRLGNYEAVEALQAVALPGAGQRGSPAVEDRLRALEAEISGLRGGR